MTQINYILKHTHYNSASSKEKIKKRSSIERFVMLRKKLILDLVTKKMSGDLINSLREKTE